MSDFFFIPLGVGDAFSARWYSSCYAVHADGHWLLVDCPHPIRKILKESGTSAGVDLDVDSFDALLLSHLHADHSSGLEVFGYFGKYVLDGRITPVLAHADTANRLWAEVLQPAMELPLEDLPPEQRRVARLNDFFELRTIEEFKSYSVGPFTIECMRTVHIEGSVAFRISAGGRTLGLSCDTNFHLPLIHWLAECDTFVHETNLGGHTPYEKLAALPEEIRKKMYLVHYPDFFDTEASVIPCLEQGRKYSV